MRKLNRIYWTCRACGMEGCSERIPHRCPYCDSVGEIVY